MEKLSDLLSTIAELSKSEVGRKVEARMAEFERNGKGSDSQIFRELCFCILTANFNAQRAIEIQEKVGHGFCELPEKRLAAKLRELGYRYPNARAGYITESRGHMQGLGRKLESFRESAKLREWLAENVKGLGYKEASHFLRNIGYKNVAIIDFHIIDILERYGLLKKPKTLNKKKYLEIEGMLFELARMARTDLARLDLYLWYMETGKILK